MSRLIALLSHDMRLQARALTEWAALILFFLIVILLLPFAIGPEPELLRRLGAGLIWLAALLMILLALEKLFLQDARDGTLDLLFLSPLPLTLIVSVRLIAQILMIIAALTVVALPGFLLLGMSLAVLPVLALSLLLGVPALVLLGGIMSAVTIALRRHPALLTLLLAPFYIPVLIFAVAACDAAAMGTSPAPHLLLLGAILALLLPTAPFAIAAALRNGQG
ncbi:MAG: heme exporter protein CcmB [Alphaproteobacteria bacterium]|nr:heme exporter protein CcmB [Alphaproteobacteria bacterium]